MAIKIYLPADDAWQEFQIKKKSLHGFSLIAENDLTGYKVYLGSASEVPIIYVMKDEDECFKSTYLDGETFRDDLIYIYDYFLSDEEDDDLEPLEYEGFYDDAYGDYVDGLIDASKEDWGEADADVYYAAFEFLSEICPDFDHKNYVDQDELISMLVKNTGEFLLNTGNSVRVTNLDL